MKKNRRLERISNLIRQTLGTILSKEMYDPKMGIITITDVEVSADLSTARVYYSLMGGDKNLEKQKNIVVNMNKYLRFRLAEKIELKYTPKINMFYDDTPQKAQKIERILKKIRDN